MQFKSRNWRLRMKFPEIKDSKISFVLVSACLMGLATRYDGNHSAIDSLPLQDGEIPIPVCPEQAGGLATPREPAEIENGAGEDVLSGAAKVVTIRDGIDVTDNFIRGAQEALKTAGIYGCKRAILKSKSPSCGYGSIYRKGELTPGNGVTAALLEQNGIEVQSV